MCCFAFTITCRTLLVDGFRKEIGMKAFLEEYGIAIFVIACIMILVAMAEPVGTAIQTAVLNTITDFTKGALTA